MADALVDDPPAPKTPRRRVYLPKSPEKFAKAVGVLIDSASPSTSAALVTEGIHDTKVRKTTTAITHACQQGSRELKSKKQLINLFREHCQQTNKSLLSKMVGISRTSLNRKRKFGSKRVSAAIRSTIERFYVDPDVSIPFPNKTKSPHPLYVLKGTGPVTFAKFKVANSDINISFTTFWSLRPRYVKMQSKARLLQCVCDICENVKLILNCVTASMAREGIEIPAVLRHTLPTIGSEV